MPSTRCPDCGRFCMYDAYYARWWCDNCERKVDPETRDERQKKLMEILEKVPKTTVLGTMPIPPGFEIVDDIRPEGAK
jgi:uncharacterized protein (DUF983 family)